MIRKLLYKSVGLGLNLWALAAPRAAGTAAYRLFGRPSKPVLRPKEADFLATAQQVRSRIDAYPVVEYHWGPADGPLVLLSYGWAYNAGRWRHFVPGLVEAGFHVVAYDPPGHGLNESGTLNLAANSQIQQGLIEKYGPVYAVLAHSFGGATAVYTLSQLPANHLPKRMVLMASFSSAPRIFADYRRHLGLWQYTYRQMIAVLEGKIGVSIQHFDMARLSAELGRTEALLVHAPDDAVTPFSNALRYQRYWPGSALWRAEGGGHHLGTSEITEGIIQFIAEGNLPEAAEPGELVLNAQHDLVRYFAGMEV